jgi:hypothetical protein
MANGADINVKAPDSCNSLIFLCSLLKNFNFLLKETDIEHDSVDRWGRKPVDYFPIEYPIPLEK